MIKDLTHHHFYPPLNKNVLKTFKTFQLIVASAGTDPDFWD